MQDWDCGGGEREREERESCGVVERAATEREERGRKAGWQASGHLKSLLGRSERKGGRKEAIPVSSLSLFLFPLLSSSSPFLPSFRGRSS